jgi:adenylylsulfate kinase
MVIWLIGLSGAGKTTLGRLLHAEMQKLRPNTVFFDGDIIREIMGNDLGHTLADRKRNAERICRLCRHLDSQGINVVCAILSIFEESHAWNRANYRDYFEVYIEARMDSLLKRQRNAIYDRALKGETRDVVGVDIPFTPPKGPHLTIANDGSLEEFSRNAARILAAIREQGKSLA